MTRCLFVPLASRLCAKLTISWLSRSSVHRLTLNKSKCRITFEYSFCQTKDPQSQRTWPPLSKPQLWNALIPASSLLSSNTELNIKSASMTSGLHPHRACGCTYLFCGKCSLDSFTCDGRKCDCSGSYWKPFSDVAGVEPTVFIQGLCSLLWVLQVPLEHIAALDTDLEKPTKRQR